MAAFARLLDTPGQIGQVTLAIEKVVEESFVSHPMAHMTRAEVKRRFEIVANIFEKLRGDLKWGIERALAKLPHYTQVELDGGTWTPDERTIWAPGDGV